MSLHLKEKKRKKKKVKVGDCIKKKYFLCILLNKNYTIIKLCFQFILYVSFFFFFFFFI